MLRTGIEQFVGFWVSESGYRLRIRKVRKDQAFVDFLDPRGAPIARPYMGGAPSMKMVAQYDDYNEDFRVDLWEEGKGLMLHLDHEYDYVLDSEQREALAHLRGDPECHVHQLPHIRVKAGTRRFMPQSSGHTI